MKHLVVCISPHGYGHAAQTASVLNELSGQVPSMKVTLRTSLPGDWLATRFRFPFEYSSEALDFGMVMSSSVRVKVDESMARYRDFHADWEARVEKEIRNLAALAPDFVLSNVAYLPLAAAGNMRIPSAGFCSLNWADIFAGYTADPDSCWIHEQMCDAYNAADIFIRPTPSMPMSFIENQVTVGPVATLGRNRKQEIMSGLNLAPGKMLVLIAPGGIPMNNPIDAWPISDDYVWLVQPGWASAREDVISLGDMKMPFIDVLASVDVLVGKPGYGSVAETACNRTPMIYVKRGDWPEEPYLLAWLKKNIASYEITEAQFEQGDILDALAKLKMDKDSIDPVVPSGVEETVAILKQYF